VSAPPVISVSDPLGPTQWRNQHISVFLKQSLASVSWNSDVLCQSSEWREMGRAEFGREEINNIWKAASFAAPMHLDL
jgi:hypothetical protein